jgi:uncharacterized coiled-coil DUF342 family protein
VSEESVMGRLEQLDKAARRAAEVIEQLRAERDALTGRVQGLEGELRAARQERKEVLAQLDTILKELDKLQP